MKEMTKNWRKKHRSASLVFVPHIIQDGGDDTDDFAVAAAAAADDDDDD